jgi:prepilin-type N-terminal cleavage/methylation domain-containing protein
MLKNSKRGFTLIELLVVIAIIGILSAIVLASLSTARNKAQDSKIQSQLSNIRSAAETIYSSTAGYGTATGLNGCDGMTAQLGSLWDTASWPSGTLWCTDFVLAAVAFTDIAVVIPHDGDVFFLESVVNFASSRHKLRLVLEEW